MEFASNKTTLPHPIPEKAGIPVVLIHPHTKRTITMKGPWESIAAGREKGHKTQKLEKTTKHISCRVRGNGWVVMGVAHHEESEGRP